MRNREVAEIVIPIVLAASLLGTTLYLFTGNTYASLSAGVTVIWLFAAIINIRSR